MVTVSNTSISLAYDPGSEKTWTDLISALRPYAKHFVYSAHVARWRGQEEDIIEDILQETVRRILERSQQAKRGEAPPIYSYKHMSIVIAHNYCIDMLRRDRRLQHTFSADYVPIISSAEDNQLSPFEIAAEQVYQEELFTQLAHEIAHFPAKQRTALLIDLANRIHFDTELTPLRKVFLAEGIDLQLYQRPLPNDPIERAKQAALTSLAYKRVAIRMHEHTLDK